MRLTSRSKGQTGMTRASAIQFLELPIDQRNFEKKELDKAFRQKARILHPDSPTGCEKKFKELQEARDFLLQHGQAGSFDFEFDEGDGNSYWSEMKRNMKDSEDFAKNRTVDYEIEHKETPASKVPQVYAYIILFGLTTIFLFYWPDIRQSIRKSPAHQYDDIREKYEREHEEAQSRKKIRELEAQEARNISNVQPPSCRVVK